MTLDPITDAPPTPPQMSEGDFRRIIREEIATHNQQQLVAIDERLANVPTRAEMDAALETVRLEERKATDNAIETRFKTHKQAAADDIRNLEKTLQETIRAGNESLGLQMRSFEKVINSRDDQVRTYGERLDNVEAETRDINLFMDDMNARNRKMTDFIFGSTDMEATPGFVTLKMMFAGLDRTVANVGTQVSTVHSQLTTIQTDVNILKTERDRVVQFLVRPLRWTLSNAKTAAVGGLVSGGLISALIKLLGG